MVKQLVTLAWSGYHAQMHWHCGLLMVPISQFSKLFRHGGERVWIQPLWSLCLQEYINIPRFIPEFSFAFRHCSICIGWLRTTCYFHWDIRVSQQWICGLGSMFDCVARLYHNVCHFEIQVYARTYSSRQSEFVLDVEDGYAHDVNVNTTTMKPQSSQGSRALLDGKYILSVFCGAIVGALILILVRSCAAMLRGQCCAQRRHQRGLAPIYERGDMDGDLAALLTHDDVAERVSCALSRLPVVPFSIVVSPSVDWDAVEANPSRGMMINDGTTRTSRALTAVFLRKYFSCRTQYDNKLAASSRAEANPHTPLHSNQSCRSVMCVNCETYLFVNACIRLAYQWLFATCDEYHHEWNVRDVDL